MLLVRTHIGIIREFPRFDAYMRTDADVDTILYSNPSLRFREFIVKDVKRLYPEFLIVYNRLDKNAIMRVWSKIKSSLRGALKCISGPIS